MGHEDTTDFYQKTFYSLHLLPSSLETRGELNFNEKAVSLLEIRTYRDNNHSPSKKTHFKNEKKNHLKMCCKS